MIVPGQYLELVRLSLLSKYNYKYLDTVTDVNNKICLSQWVCSALVSVPRPVTRWNSSTVIGHQPCCWPQSGLAPGEKTSGWRGMDRSCLVSLTSLSSPGTFHLSPLTATAPPSQSAVNNSDGCSKAGLKLSKLVWISSKLGFVHQLPAKSRQPAATFKVHRCNHKSELSDDYDQVIVCPVGRCWIIHVGGNIDYYCPVQARDG